MLITERIASIAQGAGDRDSLWISLLTQLECRDVCEIGVLRGEFSEILLEGCPQIETYTMIDPWRNLDNWNKPTNKSDEIFEEKLQLTLQRTEKFAAKRRILRDPTKTAAREIEDETLDAVYIDGDHTLRGITLDLHAILPKVRHGGIIGGDDMSPNIWQHGPKFSPTMVFPYILYFAEAHDLPILTLPFDQFCIVNRPEIGHQVIDMAGYTALTPQQVYILDPEAPPYRRPKNARVPPEKS
ncbi:class I SAM-dependent methyltransferase [Sulfitobacter porphyrae]|uniref:Class I SAM-dependent methyltransferase n=1 Tax=Sulfitobacter porphyrae TaxID=1246864 RepID=A0ABW2B320_9RHOB|nr:hypothetical protein GCM10007928_26400 [Sulfitobacter porphyrae]